MDVLAELDQVGAVYTDKHFVYTSGKHGSGYVNMDPLFTDTELLWRIGVELWLPFAGQSYDTIVAPATGGIALAYAVAYSAWLEVDIGNGGPRRAVAWADKNGDLFEFERAGFVARLRGKRVLIVEDLLTTGGSVMKVARAAESHGAEIVGVSVVVNRGGLTAADLGVPRLESLASVNFTAVSSEECALCHDGVSIVDDIGHGGEYKEAHPDYHGGYVSLLAA